MSDTQEEQTVPETQETPEDQPTEQTQAEAGEPEGEAAPSEQPTSEEQPQEAPEEPTTSEEPATQPEEPETQEQQEETPKQEEKEDEGETGGDSGAAPEGEGEGEPAATEGGEEETKAEDQAETGEGGETEQQQEEEIVEEEPVVITPEGNPHWLPAEEVLAKGLPDTEVENFRHFYFKQAYSVQKWYDVLKDFVFPTEYITLSKEEIDALSTEGEPSEDQQQIFSALEERINNAIELFEEDGALIRVNARSPKDAVLENSEESFIAQVRDAVNNEQEVEKQAVCAYAIWQDQEKNPGAFRRGLSKIRESLRRKRTHSTGKRPKLQEEEKKEGEGEAEPKAEDAKEGGEGEQAPATEGGEEEGAGGPVTVEVTVEDGEATTTTEPEAEAQPTEDGTTTEPEQTAEAPKEDGENATEGEGGDKQEVNEQPKEEEPKTEEEPKEGETKPEEGEGEKKEGGEDEIQKVEEEDKKEQPKEQPKAKSEPRRKMKPEPVDNQLVRAFGRAIGALYCVKSGKEAVEMLRKSAAIRRDLNQLKAFSGVEGVQVSVSVTRWQAKVIQYGGMVFRGFVYQNELRALSQYSDTAFHPNVAHYKATIQEKVLDFFNSQLRDPLAELENYIVDVFVAPDRVYVMRLNPFYTNIGACLFTWPEHGRVLTKGPFELRVVENPKVAPECYSGFQSHWQTMLENLLEQKRPQRRPRSACVLL